MTAEIATRGGPVLVIGNCTVDVSFAVPRLPKPGETLLAGSRRVDLGGKGANQAVVARRCGAPTTLAVPVGEDAEGDWAAARLVAEGLPKQAILRLPTGTDQSILYVAPDGENCIVSSHGAAAAATPDWAEAVVGAAAADATVLMQGNLSLATTVAALAAARGRGLRTVLNPAPVQYAYDTLFPLADIVILNAVECTELGGSEDTTAAARSIRARGAGIVIVTLGAAGAVAITGEAELSAPAPKVVAVDTVGAGDVFCGSLAACLARAVPLDRAMAVAASLAALAVTRRGTQSAFPTVDETSAIFTRHGLTP